MGAVQVKFLGTGDAFGSGGNFQTCIFVRSDATRFLIDCGASSLIAMKRFGVDPNGIDIVLLTHLHGDHFGGLPFLILDGQFSRRTRPLLIAGPAGVEERVRAAMEVLFPGSSRTRQRYAIGFVELVPEASAMLAELSVSAFPVVHPSGAPAHALRVRCDGRVIAYSGDGEWGEGFVNAAVGADLLICEAYSYQKGIRYHLDYATLMANRNQLRCRRLVVTHMGADMLMELPFTTADAARDGMEIDL